MNVLNSEEQFSKIIIRGRCGKDQEGGSALKFIGRPDASLWFA